MIETWQQHLPHGITLSCRACGKRGRPVLIFLHGFPEAAWVWDPLLVHFSKPENGGYRCVAPNLRGYERSSAPDDVKAYRAKHLVQDIVALIGLESGLAPLAALVAHDWGGAVAWSLANQHPDLLRQMVIVNSPHPGPFLKALQSHPAQQAASAYMNFLVQPDAAAQLAANDFERLLGFLDGNDRSLTSLTQPPGDLTHAAARWLTPEIKERYRQTWRHGLQGGLNGRIGGSDPARSPAHRGAHAGAVGTRRCGLVALPDRRPGAACARSETGAHRPSHPLGGA
jgi:pimeloyl-ACP methyl ester carboxylesterase